MKILYIVPKINNAGGVARVLSVKTDYLIKKWNYEIAILTQNDGASPPLFYEFNKSVALYDVKYSKKKIKFFLQFRQQLQEKINTINPDCIVVSDNGFKAYLIPFFLKTNIPVVFEAHGSRFNQERKLENIFQKVAFKISDFIRHAGAKRFDLFVALSQENLQEWNVQRSAVIPNPVWIKTPETNRLDNKRIIAVARHSYEKGLDRLLKIWKEAIKIHPDWKLDIYGAFDTATDLPQLAKKLNIEEHVNFYLPVPNIVEKYQQASIYAMTSRTEGFPMVLIEAMACGLPVIAYDCPIGPRSIITDAVDGLLIKDGDKESFTVALLKLMTDPNLRKELGSAGAQKMQHYDLDQVMGEWKLLFESVQKASDASV